MDLDGFIEDAAREKLPARVGEIFRAHWPSDTFLNGPLLAHRSDLKAGETWSYSRNTIVELEGRPVKAYYTETCALKSVKDGIATVQVAGNSELWLPAKEPNTWRQVPLSVSGTFRLDLKTRSWISIERSLEAAGMSRREKVSLSD